ncbi:MULTISPECIES: DUF2935 domain-containing protein [Alteribacter]|uniref:DUF2935 domain-containing protein n=1 Tax=Alteribacter keqinensis TaxID=2483800 RepID=A0A3M7TMG4_9BACI|nr:MULTISPECIES: DUF2935 domain-containing protein [Alteribacter]MBM7095040.1 DUF2935 domain-containing protein [Alteribacter salitolerans]RNA66833.1 DUF2935 domain-containing protein [Alteribacter keqinensis]
MCFLFDETARFEHGFWLQVMGDHARFLMDSLPVSEMEDVEITKEYRAEYDRLLQEVRNGVGDFRSFTKGVERLTDQFRSFKLSIIGRQLNGEIRIHLPPTFINHMVNELEEYQLVMSYLAKGEKPPVFHELHHHLVWLLDAAGHASGISGSLDMVEKQMQEKGNEFVKGFEDFYVKAVELSGYLRANVDSFPALRRFNDDVRLKIELFKGFLHEIEEMELSDELLSTFSPLMADHMAREECYYLMKVAEAGGQEAPGCDPSEPRLQDEM